MSTPQERRFYVYFLRRPDKDDPIGTGNGCPFYVGKGNNGRYSEHRKEADQLLHKSGPKKARISIIHKLWKQGLDFIEDVFCENLTEQEAFELEIEAIKTYGRIDLGTGCLANLTNGGEGFTGVVCFWKGKKQSADHIEKRRQANIGRIASPETKQRLRDSHLGHCPSREAIEKSASKSRGKKRLPEIIAKMSESRKKTWAKQKENGYKPPPHPPRSEETLRRLRESHLGKGHAQTEETKEKIRLANLGRVDSEERRKKNSDAQKKVWEQKKSLIHGVINKENIADACDR